MPTRTIVVSLADAVGGVTRPIDRTDAFVKFRQQVKEQVADLGGSVTDVGGNRLRVTLPADEAAPEALERAHEVDPDANATPDAPKAPRTRKAPAKKAAKKATKAARKSPAKKAPAKRSAKPKE